MLCTKCRGNRGVCKCVITAGDTVYLSLPLKKPDGYINDCLLPYLKKEGKTNMVFTVHDVSGAQIKFKDFLKMPEQNYWYYSVNFEWI